MDSGALVWSYKPSHQLYGVSDPVILDHVVIMGDSYQLYAFAFVGTSLSQPIWTLKYTSPQACASQNVYRVAPSISFYNGDVIFVCESSYVLGLSLDLGHLKWSTALACGDTQCNLKGNVASIGDMGTIYVAASDKNLSTAYLFSINAGGTIRYTLVFNEGPTSWQIPTVGQNYVYLTSSSKLFSVDVRYQRVEQLLTLQGSPTTPVIYFGEGPYGYIADSTTMHAFNGINGSALWATELDSFGGHSVEFGFGTGHIYASISTSLVAYGCPDGVTLGSAGQCDNCPAGSYLYRNTTIVSCFKCPDGMVSTGGTLPCKPCPPGFYLSYDKTECLSCEQGDDLLCPIPASASSKQTGGRWALALYIIISFPLAVGTFLQVKNRDSSG